MRHYYFEILSPIEFKVCQRLSNHNQKVDFSISEEPLYLKNGVGVGER